MEKDTTKERNYSFISPYRDVDFKKIVEENKDADFIEVRWKTEDGIYDGIVIVSESGMMRLKNACIELPPSAITNDKAILTSSGRLVAGKGCIKMTFIHIPKWAGTYELLAKRENSSYEFKVRVIL